MGGYGSGRPRYKQKAEDCRSLDVSTRDWAQIIRFSSSPQLRRLRRFATKHSDKVHLLANGH